MRKSLIAIVGSAALASIGSGLGGCAGPYAESNTSRLSSGQHTSTYKRAEIDMVNAGHDKYAIQPRIPETSIRILHPTQGDVTLPRSLVLDVRGIPYGNSTIDREGEKIAMRPNMDASSPSFLVNVTYNHKGELVIPTSGEPRETFFHISHDTLPSRTVEDKTKTFVTEVFESVKRQDPYVTMEGISLVPFPIVDHMGRRARLFIERDSMKPRSKEIREDGVLQSAAHGFEGVGYVFAPGEEVPIDPRSLDEDHGMPAVIGGEPVDKK